MSNVKNPSRVDVRTGLLYVNIYDGDKYRMREDESLTERFLAWCSEEGINPFGTIVYRKGSVCQGFYREADAAKINAWLASQEDAKVEELD